jgi:hypothetical protein
LAIVTVPLLLSVSVTVAAETKITELNNAATAANNML